MSSTDLDGISSTRTLEKFELFNNNEAFTSFKVPRRLAHLSFHLQGTVKNLSQGKDVTLSDSRSYQLNSIEKSARTRQLHLRRTSDAYILASWSKKHAEENYCHSQVGNYAWNYLFADGHATEVHLDIPRVKSAEDYTIND